MKIFRLNYTRVTSVQVQQLLRYGSEVVIKSGITRSPDSGMVVKEPYGVVVIGTHGDQYHTLLAETGSSQVINRNLIAKKAIEGFSARLNHDSPDVRRSLLFPSLGNVIVSVAGFSLSHDTKCVRDIIIGLLVTFALARLLYATDGASAAKKNIVLLESGLPREFNEDFWRICLEFSQNLPNELRDL